MLKLTRTVYQHNAFRNNFGIYQQESVKMKIKPFIPRYETIDDKSQRRKLPLSPDFGVYRPQVTTILSISHRISGIALASYTTFFGVNAILGKHEFSDFIAIVEGLGQQLGDPALIIFKYLFVYPFALHTCLGIRHLLWDCGKFLTNRDVISTGYAAFCSSHVLSLILVML